MNNNSVLGIILIAALLSGCSTQANRPLQPFEAEDLSELVKSGQLVQKTDSFLVVNDSSSSMGEPYWRAYRDGGTKLDGEKNLLNKFNKSIPASIRLSSGLRSFGFGPCVNWSRTYLNQPMQSYSQASFEKAITSLECSSGGTPLADALTEASHDIAVAPGNVALIVFSDGLDDTPSGPAAVRLKEKYGNRLCIYTVWVGNDDETDGQGNLEIVADSSGCGFATRDSQIASPDGMSDFVKKVFFKPGASQDDDQDGVPNDKDKCPDTPRGAIVDKDGCWAFHGVLFDFDSDKVKAENDPLLRNAVEVLQRNPGLTVEIQGHTDSSGTDAYNQKLSERRADSVKRELVRRGVEGRRLTTVGFGESQPAASNDTEEGRAYNRRVVFKRTDK